jgi:hypothetical protein
MLCILRIENFSQKLALATNRGEVSAAIPGGAAAWNQLVYSFSDKYQNQKTSDALFEYFMLVLAYISLVSL